jgi:hypothetical protein
LFKRRQKRDSINAEHETADYELMEDAKQLLEETDKDGVDPVAFDSYLSNNNSSKNDEFKNNVKVLYNDFEKLDAIIGGTLKYMINPFMDILLGEIISKPYEVNPLNVCIIEVLNAVSEINSESDRFLDFIESGIFSDISRRLHIMQDKIMRFYKDKNDILALYEFGNNQMAEWCINNTDSKFHNYFAFTLSQTSAFHIDSFLEYHNSNFNGDFTSFLKQILKSNKTLVSDIQIETVKTWIFEQPKINNKTEPPSVIIDFDDEIDGKLNKIEFNRFLDFLHEKKNDKKNPFLKSDDVDKLKSYGLKYKRSIWQPTLTINMSSKEKFKIYSCFAYLWSAHTEAKNTGRDLFALYLKTHFTNFKGELITVQSSLNCETKKRVGFDIGEYLPK